MATKSLPELVDSLNPEEKAVVRRFIEFLRRKSSPPRSPFLTAIDEFTEQHSELLERLSR